MLPCRRANRSPRRPSARIRSPAKTYQRAICQGSFPPVGITDLDRDEEADERQPVLDEVRRRRQDPDRSEHGIARAAEGVGARDVHDREQADEDPARVAVDEGEHPAAERRAADEVQPEAIRNPSGAVDRVAGRDQDEPGDDRHDLLGPEVDEGEPEDERNREDEERRPETAECHERGGDRQQLEQQQPRLPVVAGSVLVEDADHVLQRADEDGEEGDTECGEHAGGDRAAGLLERKSEGECGRHREHAEAEEGGAAVILAQDPEQRGGREERHERADVDESAFARPARPQRVGGQKSLEHVTTVTSESDGELVFLNTSSSRRRNHAVRTARTDACVSETQSPYDVLKPGAGGSGRGARARRVPDARLRVRGRRG